MAADLAKIEARLANMANDWRRYFKKSEEEIADLVAFNRKRLIEEAEFKSVPLRASQWIGRTPINQHSTLNHRQQGTGLGF